MKSTIVKKLLLALNNTCIRISSSLLLATYEQCIDTISLHFVSNLFNAFYCTYFRWRIKRSVLGLFDTLFLRRCAWQFSAISKGHRESEHNPKSEHEKSIMSGINGHHDERYRAFVPKALSSKVCWYRVCFPIASVEQFVNFSFNQKIRHPRRL